MRLLPKRNTLAKTVKNFLVVVAMEQGSGPNSLTHMKMKYCPRAEVMENVISSVKTAGWRFTKARNSEISPDRLEA